MGVYTMELREVLDRYDIGLQSYPIFDEEYRETLNTNIKNYFWYREIGTETVDQFVRMLNNRMLLIMPTYNQLYESARLKYDPLVTVDLKTISHQESDTTGTGNVTGRSDTTSNVSNDSRSQSINSDYPAAMLSPSGDYASSGSHSTAKTATDNEAASRSSEDSKSRSESEQDATSSTVGRQGSAAALVLEYRETIINIDLMIIQELDSLFMRIWETNDIMFERNWWYL